MLSNRQNLFAATSLAATAVAPTDAQAATAALFDQNGERIVCGVIEPA